MKRALVTGGTGFIGSNLVKELVNRGYEVIATGNDSENTLPSSVELIHSSFVGLDFKRLKDIDVVFHQSAMNLTTCKDETEMNRANVDSTAHLFYHCLEEGCRKFVYASSTAVYGDSDIPFREDGIRKPLNAYGKSKALMENVVKVLGHEYSNAKFIGLRYCNVYGPGEYHKGSRASMIYQLASAIRYRPPKIFEFGQQRRDYIYIKDVVKANILASDFDESMIFNCGTGQSTSFNELVKILNNLFKKSWEPAYIPNPYIESYQNHTLCDMTLAKEKLKFTPDYDIEKGIEDYKKNARF